MDEQEINRCLETMTQACQQHDCAETLLEYATTYGTRNSMQAAWRQRLLAEHAFDEANHWLLERDLSPIWNEDAQRFVLTASISR